jgi:hypothetical protein
MTPLMMIPLGAFAVRVALSTKFGGDRVCLFYPAPIVRNAGEERELTMARWGMPSSQRALMDALCLSKIKEADRQPPRQ